MAIGIVYDLETTGLPPAGNKRLPGITQIAIERWENGKQSTFKSLINPELMPDEWEQGAIKVTGIGPDEVKDAPSLFEAFPKIVEMFVGAEYLFGYNHISFDNEVLHRNLVRYGFERNFPWPPKHIDVMKLVARRINEAGKRGTRNMKLIEAYEKTFTETFDGAHDALADVQATSRLLFHYEPEILA